MHSPLLREKLSDMSSQVTVVFVFIASMIEGEKIERENPDDPPVRIRK